MTGVMGWPSRGPREDWPGRLLCADPWGAWVFDCPEGPLARVSPGGEAVTFHTPSVERLAGDRHGCWAAVDPGWSFDNDPPPTTVTYVGMGGDRHDYDVPGPVAAFRDQGQELAVEYYASGPQDRPGGEVRYDYGTITLPWPASAGQKRITRDSGDALMWGALLGDVDDGEPVGRCGGLAWSRRHGGRLGTADWNRAEMVVGTRLGRRWVKVKARFDGSINALGVTDRAVWLTRQYCWPPGDTGRADLWRIQAGSRTPEPILPPDRVDITGWCVQPIVPEGLDIDAYASRMRDELAEFFLGGWRGPDGDAVPFAAGAATEQVILTGTWPDTTVRVIFTHDSRPGLRFIRDIPLFDEAGRPLPDDGYPDISLMEDIEAADHELPPPQQCIPGPDGLVPF